MRSNCITSSGSIGDLPKNSLLAAKTSELRSGFIPQVTSVTQGVIPVMMPTTRRISAFLSEKSLFVTLLSRTSRNFLACSPVRNFISRIIVIDPSFMQNKSYWSFHTKNMQYFIYTSSKRYWSPFITSAHHTPHHISNMHFIYTYLYKNFVKISKSVNK